jgi:hypothetical protein
VWAGAGPRGGVVAAARDLVEGDWDLLTGGGGV